MKIRTGLGVGWLAVTGLLVLAARWLTYALAQPSPLANRFEESAGGPQLVVVAVVCLGLAAVASAATVWLVAVGVRERQRLEPRRELPRLRLGRLAGRAAGLYASSALAFAMFESYLHWRAGLGFHGLSCLVGPVHRNAIPVLAGLALLAAAAAEAAQHLLDWMRSVAQALLRVFVTSPPPANPIHRHDVLLPPAFVGGARPRAPPLPA